MSTPTPAAATAAPAPAPAALSVEVEVSANANGGSGGHGEIATTATATTPAAAAAAASPPTPKSTSSTSSSTSTSSANNPLLPIITPAIRTIMEGSRFRRVDSSNTASPVTEVFVWYEPEHGKLGQIFWSTTGDKQKTPECSMLLQSVTDVFPGRQGPEKMLAEFSSSRCFTLQSKLVTLSLVGYDSATRTVWISAVKDAFAVVTKKAQAKAASNTLTGANAAAAAAAASNTNATTAAPAVPPAAPAATLAPAPAPTSTSSSTSSTSGEGSTSSTAPTATTAPTDASSMPPTSVPPAARQFVRTASLSCLTVIPSDKAVQVLREGAPFNMYWGVHSGIVKRVFVWCEDDPSDPLHLGVLHYVDGAAKPSTPLPNTGTGAATLPRLSLRDLCEIFTGKVSREFQSTEAARAVATNCFSLVTKDTSLHLEALEATVRRNWLRALTSLFSHAGHLMHDQVTRAEAQAVAVHAAAEQLSEQDKLSLLEQGVTATLLMHSTVATAVDLSSSANANSSNGVGATSNGSSNNGNDNSNGNSNGSAALHKVEHIRARLWLSRSQTTSATGNNTSTDTLCWIPMGRDANLPAAVKASALPRKRTLPLSLVTRLVEGKSMPEFLQPSNTLVGTVSVYRCSSILSAEPVLHPSLHLVYDTEDDMIRWFESLKFATARAASATSTSPSPSSSSTAGAPAPASTELVGLTPAAAITPGLIVTLADGYDVTLLRGSRATATAHPAIFFLERSLERKGALCWCDRTRGRQVLSSQLIPVHALSDVYIGKRTPESVSAAAEPIDASTIISFESKSLNARITVAASSASERHDILTAVRACIKAQKGVLAQGALRALPPAPTAAPTDAIKALERGDAAFVYTASSDVVIKRRAFVWLDRTSSSSSSSSSAASKLCCKFLPYAATATSVARTDADLSLSLDATTDLFVGKARSELHAKAAQSAAPTSCLSVVTVQHGLHLELFSEEVRCGWIASLAYIVHQAIAAAGGQIVSGSSTPSSRSSSTSSSSSTATTATGAQGPADTLLSKRHRFVRHELIGDSAATHTEQVDVWLHTDSRQPPMLVWVSSTSLATGSSAEAETLALRRISDVFVGKHSPLFGQSSFDTAVRDRGFSLVTKTGALHLEAESGSVRRHWLAALQHVFSKSGKPVLENDSKSSAGKSVLTPFGIGQPIAPAAGAAAGGAAASSSASTTITAVKLPFGTGYLAPSSIAPIINVHTAFGVGVLLTFSRARADHLVAVQLPSWRVAYLDASTLRQPVSAAALPGSISGPSLSTPGGGSAGAGAGGSHSRQPSALDPSAVGSTPLDAALAAAAGGAAQLALPSVSSADFTPSVHMAQYLLRTGNVFYAVRPDTSSGGSSSSSGGGSTKLLKSLVWFAFQANASSTASSAGTFVALAHPLVSSLPPSFDPSTRRLTFAFESVRDLFVGKHTDTFLSAAMRSVPDAHCFSVRTSGGLTLDLIAGDRPSRDSFVQSLRVVIGEVARVAAVRAKEAQVAAAQVAAAQAAAQAAQATKTAQASSKVAATSSPVNTAAAAATTTAATTSTSAKSVDSSSSEGVSTSSSKGEGSTGTSDNTSTSSVVSTNPSSSGGGTDKPAEGSLLDGVDVFVWTGNEASSSKQRMHLHLGAGGGRLGSLYWGASGVEGGGQRLAVRDVTDVYMGRRASALLSPEAASVRKDRCFSISAKSLTLAVEMDSRQQRDAWMSSFKALFAAGASSSSSLKQ